MLLNKSLLDALMLCMGKCTAGLSKIFPTIKNNRAELVYPLIKKQAVIANVP